MYLGWKKNSTRQFFIFCKKIKNCVVEFNLFYEQDPLLTFFDTKSFQKLVRKKNYSFSSIRFSLNQKDPVLISVQKNSNQLLENKTFFVKVTIWKGISIETLVQVVCVWVFWIRRPCNATSQLLYALRKQRGWVVKLVRGNGRGKKHLSFEREMHRRP